MSVTQTTWTGPDAVEHALSPRVAQMVAQIIEGAADIDRIGAGRVEIWFEGKKTHALYLTERLTAKVTA